MTKQLSSAFFGAKKLTKVLQYLVRKYINFRLFLKAVLIQKLLILFFRHIQQN